MFSHVIYNRYSDNAAITASGVSIDGATIEDGYDVEWIRDLDPARPVRLQDTSGFFKYQFAEAVQVEIVAVIHANYEEDTIIKVQANHSDSWGSPAFETTLTAPEWKAGRFPGNPWKLLGTLSGIDAYEWWRVGTDSANSVAVSVGEIWLGTEVREFNVQWNDRPVFDRPQVEHQTAYRKLRAPLGTTRRGLTGVIPADDDIRQEIIDWVLDADGRPVLFIPEHTANPPEAWLALHQTTRQEIDEEFDDANFIPLAMEEVGRGLEPTPSPLA